MNTFPTPQAFFFLVWTCAMCNHLLSDVSNIIPFPFICPLSLNFQATNVILLSNDAAFISFQSIPYIPGLHEYKRSILLWNFYNFDRVFLQSYFFHWYFELLYFNKFFTKNAQKGLKILGGTSTITSAIKVFSFFRLKEWFLGVRHISQILQLHIFVFIFKGL